jgi:hypothetical protein
MDQEQFDQLYVYLLKRSKVFQNMGMDQQGQFMIKLKKILDKFNIK